MTDTRLLKAKIIEKGLTIGGIAQEIGISHSSMSYKINNKRQFTVNEIYSMCNLLDIKDKDPYFFNCLVGKTATKQKTK